MPNQVAHQYIEDIVINSNRHYSIENYSIHKEIVNSTELA